MRDRGDIKVQGIVGTAVTFIVIIAIVGIVVSVGVAKFADSLPPSPAELRGEVQGPLK